MLDLRLRSSPAFATTMSAKRTRRGAVTVLSTTGQTDYVFQPQRAAEVSLILSAVASFVGIVFLIRVRPSPIRT